MEVYTVFRDLEAASPSRISTVKPSQRAPKLYRRAEDIEVKPLEVTASL